MMHPPTHDQQRDALRFVRMLTGGVHGCETWQLIFDDKTKRQAADVVHGSLYEVGSRLVYDNLDGFGVFITVNATDGKRRKGYNISRIRALFVDCDEVIPESWHLEPSIVVHTRRGPHAYWLVSDCPLDQFGPAQSRLAKHYGSDPVVKDLPRVMRVPGFWHSKYEPTMIVLGLGNGKTYTTAQILDGIAPLPAPIERKPVQPPKVREGFTHWTQKNPAIEFERAGMYGRPLGQQKHAVCCPWWRDHSVPDNSGTAGDTVVFETGSTGKPSFHCAHSHCVGKTLVDAYKEIGAW